MRLSILIVDDDLNNRRFLSRVLEQAEYNVLQATSGMEALRQIYAQQVDLVITDIFMPGMEGLELIRGIKKSRPNLNIIAISGALDATLLKELELCEVTAALHKPFGPQTLLEVIAALKRHDSPGFRWASGSSDDPASEDLRD